MAVLEMRRVSICALQKNRKVILEMLQKSGWMEIDREKKEDDTFLRQDTSSMRGQIQKEQHQAQRALEIINEYAPGQKVSFESLRGKMSMEEDIYAYGKNHEEVLLKTSEELTAIDRDIIDLKAQIARLENQKDELIPWMSLPIPMNYAGTKTCDCFIGTFSSEKTTRDIEVALAQKGAQSSLFDMHILYASKDITSVIVFAHKTESRQVEEDLRKIGFARPSNLLDEVPKDFVEKIDPSIQALQAQIDEKIKAVESYADKKDELKIFIDYCGIRASKYEVLSVIPQTKSAFALTGYMPSGEAKRIQEVITQKYDAVVEVEELTPDDDAPVVLKNNWFATIGESTVTSYAFPGKSEVDPSGIMMIFYVIFFGLMLSDAAYGAILSLATGIMLLKFPKMPQGTKSLIQLFFLCGFSTLFWGVMFGGYFGDAFDIIATTYLGISMPEGATVVPAVWFTPLNNPMRLLMVCLLFGLIHMFTGMIIKGYQKLRAKDYKAFIADDVATICFILGLIFMLLPTSLFESIAQMEFNFPSFISVLAKALTIVGAVIILLFSSDAKNPLLRILLGVYAIYNNITGWLSDTLSYSRLLALGLATGVIASVINQMGSMGGNSIVGTVVFIIVFIFGHIFNMAINLLGAYVHTCRLQYVEFFNKFFDGGGRKFNPYFADTKYVDIHEGGQRQ